MSRRSLACLLAVVFPVAWGGAEDLPVRVPDLLAKVVAARVPVTFAALRNVVPTGDGKGLHLDLGDPTLQGTFQLGTFPFAEGDADVPYSLFRFTGSVVNGQCDLGATAFLSPSVNVNQWPDGPGLAAPTMTLAARFDLLRLTASGVQTFGSVDSRYSFQAPGGSVQPNLTIVEGPLVNMLESGDPSRVVISWRTDRPASGKVRVVLADCSCGESARSAGPLSPSALEFLGNGVLHHKVAVTGLRPATRYLYLVESQADGAGSAHSAILSFRTAPPAGHGNVSFLAAGDSPEAAGGPAQAAMGVNKQALQDIALQAVRQNVDLALFGGDLVYGFASDEADYRLQLQAWKDAWTPFWASRPVYAVPGNHETLANYFEDGSTYGLALDKWPYADHSAEAVFTDELVHPDNGPVPDDPRRPPYAGTAYTLQYGPVLFVGLNDFYWWTTDDKIPVHGGAPEGYLMDDQLRWFEGVMAAADRAPSVRFIVVFMHEPAFPCGAYTEKGLWWDGNNNVRAFARAGDAVVPAGEGVIDVRNRFWRTLAQSPKSAVLVAGHQHGYSRLLVDRTTPVGLPATDDTNGDGILDRFSPNPEFRHPVWQIIAGNGGANYYHYSAEGKPWRSVRSSSQQGYCVFRTTGRAMSMTSYALTGQVIDHVDDLMAVKHPPRVTAER